MKHPSKKFAFEVKLTDQNKESILSKMEGSFALSERRRAAPNQQIFAVWKDDDGKETLLPAFQVDGPDGEPFSIPSINLVVLYYDNAYLNWIQLQEHRTKLLSHLNQHSVKHDALNSLYAYYGRCISCIQSLFAAMEALVSINVDKTTVYKRNTGTENQCDTTWDMNFQWGETELVIGAGILRLSMWEKLNRVLPQLSSRHFGASNDKSWILIKDLKKLRDNITHPKSVDRKALFDELFATMFNYDFGAAMEAVKLFINFYANGDAQRIRDCECGLDW